MAFNITTFFFEIINFLILVWILQRLFYKPVLAIVNRRQTAIEESLAQAQKLHDEAEALRSAYENRQQAWDQEKEAAYAQLQQELTEQRRLQLELLRQDLAQARLKDQEAVSRQEQAYQNQVEKQALTQGAQFAALLLQHAASQELESCLIGLLIEQLNKDLQTLTNNLQRNENAPQIITVTTAYPMNLSQRQLLQQKFATLVHVPNAFHYQEDPALLAGIRIDIGAWVLHADLQHELAGFTDLRYDTEPA
jgi:F-type H+-transporting ATPase subunit b